MSDILNRWNDLQNPAKSASNPDDADHKTLSPPHPAATPGKSEDSGAQPAKPDSGKALQFAPTLNGRLADHLSKEPKRKAIPRESVTPVTDTCILDQPQELAATATALILASHIARFSGTALSEEHLKSARDKLIQCFNPKDAVKLEVEAYEMLQWFAGAIDAKWQSRPEEKTAFTTESVTSEETLIKIIQHAIDKHRDLDMSYYTGYRGEFSERRITPLEITAEKYLLAFCHLRQEKRVFQLLRIVKLTPLPSDMADDDDPLATLSYPSAEDTKLPPLPEIPVPSPEDEKPRKPPKTQSKHQRSRNSSTSKGHSHKKDSTPQQDAPLFDFAKSHKDKSNPRKNEKKRNVRPHAGPHQSKLPGLDD